MNTLEPFQSHLLFILYLEISGKYSIWPQLKPFEKQYYNDMIFSSRKFQTIKTTNNLIQVEIIDNHTFILIIKQSNESFQTQQIQKGIEVSGRQVRGQIRLQSYSLNYIIVSVLFLKLQIAFIIERLYNNKNILLSSSIMFYFVYSPLVVPNGFKWLLPVSQISQSCQFKDQQSKLKELNDPISPIYPSKVFPKDLTPIVITQTKSKKPKQILKPKIVTNDDDYHPEVYVANKCKKMPQLQNRNVIPNAVRLIFSFIQKKGKSENILEKLFEQHSADKSWSIKRFYLYHSMVKSRMNNYVNQQTLAKMVRLHPQNFDVINQLQQQFYNKITRILINYFLRDQFLSSVLTSKRMDKSKTYHHLNALRTIRLRLKTLINE